MHSQDSGHIGIEVLASHSCSPWNLLSTRKNLHPWCQERKTEAARGRKKSSLSSCAAIWLRAIIAIGFRQLHSSFLNQWDFVILFPRVIKTFRVRIRADQSKSYNVDVGGSVFKLDVTQRFHGVIMGLNLSTCFDYDCWYGGQIFRWMIFRMMITRICILSTHSIKVWRDGKRNILYDDL